jgi:guanylate kinase
MSDYSGNLYIVAAPSGGGKTSLVSQLVDDLKNIEVSISHTTRPMRPGEQQGVDYFFVSQEYFSGMIARKEFLEHAEVFNHCYGTSLDQITQRMAEGIDVVLDIDWQGAQQIKQVFPEAVSIFIIPPSLDVLMERLMNRGQDKQAVIHDRMKKAQDELSHYKEFDYLIVNDDFKQASRELSAVVIANRLQLKKQSSKQAKLLSFLLSEQ